ncbi:MAG: dTDP-4-dehydrorhamnose reductase [Thermodesulfobacteriota bacterium]
MDDLKIIVTGGGGGLAADLIPRLTHEGHTVSAFTSTELDITGRERVMEAFASVRPDLIYNLAAYTKVDRAEVEAERAFKVNSEGAANVADAAAISGAPLVHISTDFVFSGLNPLPYTEDDETGPLSVYGESKLAGEIEIKKILGDHLIVRSSWLYGGGESGVNFVKTILRLATENEELKVVSDQVGSPTWTGDLAGFLVEIAKRRWDGSMPYGTFHYAGSGVASWYDLAVAAVTEASALGKEFKCKTIEPISTAEYPTDAERPPYSVLCTKKARDEFGIDIPHWRVSLREMLKEFYSSS